MAQMVGRKEKEHSPRVLELPEIGRRSIVSSSRCHTSSFRSSSGLSSAKGNANDQYGLQLAEIETFERIRSSLFDKDDDNADGVDGKEKGVVVDVPKLGDLERHEFIEKLIKHIEDDNLRLLQKIRNRIDK